MFWISRFEKVYVCRKLQTRKTTQILAINVGLFQLINIGYLQVSDSLRLTYLIISGKAATSDPASIKSHFEELYSQKKDKQPDLETIKNTIAGLLGDPQATDKSNIRDVQSEVCSQWHDFTELLIDLIVMQVRDQCYSYCLFYIFATRCCWLTMYCWCPADGNIRQQFPSLYRETRVHAL